MNKTLLAAACAAVLTSCTMQNPFFSESSLEYGAPEFDKIKTEHYLPAIKKGIEDGKKEIDAIVNNPEAPTFANTIEAMENAGELLDNVLSIFYNIKEAHSNPELEKIAEEVSPMLNDYSMYISLNPALFAKVKSVYEGRDTLGLDPDQMKVLVESYKGFVRGGANLNDTDKETYSKLSEELSLATLKFGQNYLNATNAYHLNITDEAQLAGLPGYIVTLGKETAEQKGEEGWSFDLSYPSYGPFMRFSDVRELREQMWRAYNTRCVGGEFDNTELVKQITKLRLEIANILGYKTYADYALEDRMLKTPSQVDEFLESLRSASVKPAFKELEQIYKYAVANGFEGKELQSWDFSYWSEKYKNEKYTLSESDLKPYFRLEDCIDAVFGLAGKLYGLQMVERKDLPVYQEDVKCYDVLDADGTHLSLLYVDFFPRESKRGGAWMTEFRGQKVLDGKEIRPIVNLVTNFTKPTAESPSLITHDELETFLHEFGHCLHGMLAKGRYGSLTGTNVSRDFVELPSQIMENWAYEPEFLQGFAKHYETGEVIPMELVNKIVASKNYLSAYYQMRQLSFGILDMNWHEITEPVTEDFFAFEKKALQSTQILPYVEGSSISASIAHLFSGGYASGYYSYKWAEVLEADAFSLFKEKGIFNKEVATSFRKNILEKGSQEDEAQLFRNFRGRDPQPEALLKKLGIAAK